jgi:hypothetical protein
LNVPSLSGIEKAQCHEEMQQRPHAGQPCIQNSHTTIVCKFSSRNPIILPKQQNWNRIRELIYRLVSVFCTRRLKRKIPHEHTHSVQRCTSQAQTTPKATTTGLAVRATLPWLKQASLTPRFGVNLRLPRSPGLSPGQGLRTRAKRTTVGVGLLRSFDSSTSDY